MGLKLKWFHIFIHGHENTSRVKTENMACLVRGRNQVLSRENCCLKSAFEMCVQVSLQLTLEGYLLITIAQFKSRSSNPSLSSAWNSGIDLEGFYSERMADESLDGMILRGQEVGYSEISLCLILVRLLSRDTNLDLKSQNTFLGLLQFCTTNK